jgi:hypothetical protein
VHEKYSCIFTYAEEGEREKEKKKNERRIKCPLQPTAHSS